MATPTAKYVMTVEVSAVPSGAQPTHPLTIGRVLDYGNDNLVAVLDTLPTWAADEKGVQIPFNGRINLVAPTVDNRVEVVEEETSED